MLSLPTKSTRDGVAKPTASETVQFKTVATLTDLSCIISAMYNQVIGPEENSKTAMKAFTANTVGIVYGFVF